MTSLQPRFLSFHKRWGDIEPKRIGDAVHEIERHADVDRVPHVLIAYPGDAHHAHIIGAYALWRQGELLQKSQHRP